MIDLIDNASLLLFGAMMSACLLLCLLYLLELTWSLFGSVMNLSRDDSEE